MGEENIELFDIIIPVGPEDNKQLLDQLQYTCKNIIGYKKIYIICFDIEKVIEENREVKQIENVILINESLFPFSLKTVSNIHGNNGRNGWYLQQLLKLYIGFILPNITEKYLVIDCDTYFLKPTTFIEDGKCLYNVGDEYHIPYFEHMDRLNPILRKTSEYSGICHHMMFEKKYIKEIFNIVEGLRDFKEPFWLIFLNCVDGYMRNTEPYPKSGASEYEIYFHYMAKFHADKIKIRFLDRRDVKELPMDNPNNYDYVSWHYRFR